MCDQKIHTYILLTVFIFVFVVMGKAQENRRMAYDSVEMQYNGKMRLYSDTAVFQGYVVKFDIGNMLIELISSRGKIKNFEGAFALRLKKRFYPIIEGGYVNAYVSASGGDSKTNGFFLKPGLDINGLRKHPESLNAFLVGIRLGYAFQHYSATNVAFNDPYWQKMLSIDYSNIIRNDVWGEVVAGCNVHIYSGLMMGWYARVKILFTRTAMGKPVLTYYIPGFGYRDKIAFGFNYYIAYKF